MAIQNWKRGLHSALEAHPKERGCRRRAEAALWRAAKAGVHRTSRSGNELHRPLD